MNRKNCGNKIEQDAQAEEVELAEKKAPEKILCKVCGHELNIDDEFCSKCGISISKGTVRSKIKESTKRLNFWACMSPFVKVASILLIIAVALFAVSIYIDNQISIIISVIQLLVATSSLLIHKQAVKANKTWVKYSLLTAAVLLLIVAILLVAANLLICLLNRDTRPANTTKDIGATPAITVKYVSSPYDAKKCVGETHTIVSHSFTAAGFKNISEKAIEDLEVTEDTKDGIVESVEIAGKTTFRKGEEFDQKDDVVIYYHTFKTSYAPISSEDAVAVDTATLEALFLDAGFADIAFDEVTDLDPDKTDSEFENEVRVGDTSEFSTDDKFALNSEIKIITHYPFEKYTVKVSVNFVSNLFFSRYDVNFSINGVKEKTLAHGEDADFEFRLESGDYKFTFSSAESSSVKGETSVKVNSDINAAYTISCHRDNITVNTDYIENLGAASEDEVMLSTSASTYRGKDYKDVEKALKEAGFTNISTEILYDIIFGWTKEGETDKVSIDGKTDFKRGDIFSKDAPVIITYHMKEEDDPGNKDNSTNGNNTSNSLEGKLEKTFPKEYARRAAVVAMTNGQATDVFKPDGNTLDPRLFHSYSDLSGFYLTVYSEGKITTKDGVSWLIDDLILKVNGYDTYFKVSMKVSFDGTNYIVSNVTKVTGALRYLDSNDPSKIGIDKMEPSESNSFLTVSPSLIKNDRGKDLRAEWISGQFNSWNGKHPQLEKLIKKNLNDEKSYKHIGTSFIDVVDETAKSMANDLLANSGYTQRVEVGDLLITSDFSAKNAFNATIKSTAIAIAHYKSDTIELIGIE